MSFIADAISSLKADYGQSVRVFKTVYTGADFRQGTSSEQTTEQTISKAIVLTEEVYRQLFYNSSSDQPLAKQMLYVDADDLSFVPDEDCHVNIGDKTLRVSKVGTVGISGDEAYILHLEDSDDFVSDVP